ncbi:hypothetical protein [Bradyrhizobium cenepequi]|uniref:hypothetical protein n=1 Tax=Bradyrhizobium cenepequi TaxID=2821403 RepID=UPI001CE3438E|nr:hypothetical protein [Bradyrhizobium cenepequi]MCA6109376.1 hypothetical protein [Bradyrhizobium cenepequi]
MARHAPLRLIAGGRDGQVNRSVDQADTGAARATGAFSNDIQELSCDSRTRLLGAAARQHLLVAIAEVAKNTHADDDDCAEGVICP